MAGAKPVSYAARFYELARAAPDAPCLSVGSETVSRGAFDRRSSRIARSLRDRGVGQGDFLTIALPNVAAFLEVAAACWKIGATPQPVSWRLPRAELDAIVELAASPFIVGHTDLAASAKVTLPEDLLDGTLDDTPLDDAISPHWKAPTSGGSTGRPKLIVADQPSIVSEALPKLFRMSGEDVLLVPAPLYHNAPFVISALGLLEGAHVVLLAKFDAECLLAAARSHRATWLYLVPTMMSRILKLPPQVRAGFDPTDLRTVWHMSAPCPAWVKQTWIDWIGPERLLEVYSSTEAVAATQITGSEWLLKPGSVGRVVLGEIQIVGDDGSPCGSGEAGEIYMRPTGGAPAQPEDRSAGYHYRGAEAKRLPGGWESVGDLGWLDADGYLFLADRRTDLILAGGANVYPAEVEAAIEAHADVESCAVIGLPDDDLGQRVHAIVQARGGLTEAALMAHLERMLVRYKLPRSVEFIATPLRDDAGKVRRSQLREERIAPD